jgi:tetratricopeptide (TPR) repeat protein
MTGDLAVAVESAHSDVQDIFRANAGDLAGACRQARDRLAAIPEFDPEDPALWPAAAALTADLRLLLGFLAETTVPSGEPAGFRALVLAVLRYLYLAEQHQLGLLLAEEIHRRWTAELDPAQPDRIIAVERHAACLVPTDLDAALPLFEEAFESWSRNYGPADARALKAAANLCLGLNRVRRYQEALRLGEDTVRRCRRELGEDSAVTLNAANRFADSLCGLGDHRTALSAYRDIHERYTRKHSADHLTTLSVAEQVAISLAEVGDLEAARVANEDVLRRYERVLATRETFPREDSRIRRSRDRLSANLRALGRDEEAAAVYGTFPDF